MVLKPADTQDAENKIRDILRMIGEDVEREGLINTPRRVIKAWLELLHADEPRLAIFDAKGYSQMVTERGIQFYSLCEHHVLPFFGTVSISYIPKDKIVGLSKLSRIVDFFSKRLNTQEYMTENIANYISEKLSPVGVGVLVRGRHLCKEMRGAKAAGEMVTTALRGAYLDQRTREEFLSGA